MLSVDTIVNTGKVLLGMAVGAATIFFNQIENAEMNKGKMLGLRTTAYAVSDIKAAKAWYTNAFETEPYFDEDFHVGFSIGGYELGLFPHEKHQTSNMTVFYPIGASMTLKNHISIF